MKNLITFILLFSTQVFAGETLAINIALKAPDALVKQVIGINANLKNDNPESFNFDSTHIPHVTILQLFIDSKSLNDLQLLVSKNLPKVARLKVKDFESSSLEKKAHLSLLNLAFKNETALSDLQKELIKLTLPYRLESGTKEAFFQSEVDPQFIMYVTDFIKENSGDNYSPHLTLGLAKNKNSESYVLRPNDEFVFSELIVAQIGNYGTARKILKTYKLNFP